jgi:hypothetical protein
MATAIIPAAKPAAFRDRRSPGIPGRVNACAVTVVTAKADGVRRSHPDADDVFAAPKARAALERRGRRVAPGPVPGGGTGRRSPPRRSVEQ